MINLKASNFPSKFCFGFVLYHPPLGFWESLNLLLNSSYKVYLVDNTTDSSCKNYIYTHYDEYLQSGLLCLNSSSSNVGLSRGIKLLIREASKTSHMFLVYLDQDTYLSNHPDRLFMLLDNVSNALNDYSAIHFSPTPLKITSNINISVNSGTAFNIKDFSDYDLIPDFFLEMIDFAISLNLRSSRLNSLMIDASSVLVHESTEQTTYLSYLCKAHPIRFYSYERLYNIMKNSALLFYDGFIHNDVDFNALLLMFVAKVFINQFFTRLIVSIDRLLAFLLTPMGRGFKA